MKLQNYFLIFSFFCIKIAHPTGIAIEEYPEQTEVTHKLSGYIKFEAYGDTRQVIGTSSDHCLSLPENKDLDLNGKDKNGNGQMQMAALETILRYDFSGPKICNAQTFAVIEADFTSNNGYIDFETEAINDNLLRLSLAFIQLDFKKVSLTFGQEYHPVYVPECYADTVSYNSGSPYDLYSKSPQFRFTYHYNTMDLILCAASQIVGYTSTGPVGFINDYIRNAIMPNFHAQSRFTLNNHYFGIGYDIKRLRPRLYGENIAVQNNGFVTSESLISQAGFAYHTYNDDFIKICSKLMYAQNGVDLGALGGYAIHTIDPITDRRTYTNIDILSALIDFNFTPCKNLQPGLFIGYLHNLGSKKTIDMSVDQYIFGFGENVAQSFRIAPRCRWIYDNITFAAELEYTAASYGELINENNKAKVKNSSWVTNTRFLLATYYFF